MAGLVGMPRHIGTHALPVKDAGPLAGLRIGRDLVGIAAGVDGGTGPRVGLAVQRISAKEAVEIPIPRTRAPATIKDVCFNMVVAPLGLVALWKRNYPWNVS